MFELETAERLRSLPPYLFADLDRKKREVADSGIDLIDLSHLDADSERRGQQDLVFADAAGTAHALWASAAGNGVLVQADVTGDGKADFEVLVLGLKSLDADDFLF